MLAAPISRAASLAASASASAACLWGIVTLAPTKPAAPSARTVSREQLRRAPAAADSASRACRARRAPRCASRASGCAPPASRAPPSRASARSPCLQAGGVPAVLRPPPRCRRPRRLRTGRGVGEHLLAAAVGAGDVVQVGDVRGVGRRFDRRDPGVARSASAAGLCGVRVLYGESMCSSLRSVRACRWDPLAARPRSRSSRRSRAACPAQAVVDDRGDLRPVTGQLRLALDHRGHDQQLVRGQCSARARRDRRARRSVPGTPAAARPPAGSTGRPAFSS